MNKTILSLAIVAFIFGCKDDGDSPSTSITNSIGGTIKNYPLVDSMFARGIDLRPF